jgi:hypothetical protein
LIPNATVTIQCTVYAVGLAERRITNETLYFLVVGHPLFLGRERKPREHAPVLGSDIATVNAMQVSKKLKILL